MHNDLIILTFEREEPTEVLLSPAVLANVTRFMSDSLTILASQLRGGQTTRVNVLLYSAEQGSLVVKLRAVVDAARSVMPSRDAIGFTADLGAVVQMAATGVIAVGVATGLLVVTKEEKVESPQELEVVIGKNPSPELKKAVEGWVSAALEAGVTNILISVPDAPQCELSSARWIDKKLFGSEAKFGPSQIKTIDVLGDLELNGDPVKVEIQGSDGSNIVELFPGKFSIKSPSATQFGNNIPVLVEWRSKREVPFDRGRVLVKGTIFDMRTARNGFEPIEPVRLEGRKSIAFLVVLFQVVEE